MKQRFSVIVLFSVVLTLSVIFVMALPTIGPERNLPLERIVYAAAGGGIIAGASLVGLIYLFPEKEADQKSDVKS